MVICPLIHFKPEEGKKKIPKSFFSVFPDLIFFFLVSHIEQKPEEDHMFLMHVAQIVAHCVQRYSGLLNRCGLRGFHL